MVYESVSSSPLYVQELLQDLEKIAALDTEQDLIRPELGSRASFNEWRGFFEAIKAYVAELQELPWHKLTEAQIESVKAPARQLLDALQAVKTFNIETDPFPEREARVNTISTHFNRFRDITTPLVGFLSWQLTNLASIKAEISSTLTRIEQTSSELVESLRQKSIAADEALGAIRTISATAGVAYHADVFGTRAAAHEERAKRFLVGSIVVATAAVGAAVLMVSVWSHSGDDIKDAAVVQFIALKALVLTLLLFGFVNTVRVYRAESHLAVLSRHREDSLRTFRAFADGTDDPAIKNQVLLEATRAVFTLPTTGLIDGKEGGDTVAVINDLASGVLGRTS